MVGASVRRLATAAAGVVVHFGFLLGLSKEVEDSWLAPLPPLDDGGGVSLNEGWALKSLRFRERVVAFGMSDSRRSTLVLNLMDFSEERDSFR